MKPDMPFGDWIDLWHPYYCKPALRATTVDSYENYIYRHMIPEIGSIPLCNLTHNDLQQFYAITDTMRAQAAVKIDREIGGTNAPLPESTDSKASDHPPHQNATETVFEPYTPKVRKRGTGCVYQVNDHLWEGSFYPRLPDGKRKKFNVYAKTRDECEKLLTEMIAEKKAEITELKQKAKQHKKGGIKKRSPLKICIGVNKEKI